MGASIGDVVFISYIPILFIYISFLASFFFLILFIFQLANLVVVGSVSGSSRTVLVCVLDRTSVASCCLGKLGAEKRAF